MDQYTNRHHPDYVPGTFNIYHTESLESGLGHGHGHGPALKKDKHGIVLFPQPSDSPNDPLNWSKYRKLAHFALMAFITAFTAATSNDAGAAQDSLNEIYNISYDSMNTGAGVLFLGIGWGTLFLAPFANLYGRKITYLICTMFGLIGAVWFGRASKTADTIWSQLFVGMSESCAEAQVQLSLTDIYFQHQLGSVLTVYILATSIGTFLGPLIAGYISGLTSFRWVGYCAAIISGALLVWILLGCEETYFDRSQYMTPLASQKGYEGVEDDSSYHNDAEVDSSEKKICLVEKFPEKEKLSSSSLENRFPGKREKSPEVYETGEELIDGSKEPLKPYWQRIKIITKSTALRGYGVRQYVKYIAFNMRMFLFPPVWLSGLFWGMQDVLLSFYLTTEDNDFYDAPWNYSDYGVAIMNVPTLIGAVIGCLYAGIISDYFVLWMARRNNGIQEAEYRLYFTVAAALICPAGLLMFGIGTAKQMSWPVIYIGLGFIGFGWGCSGDIAMSYLMDCYPEMVLEGMVCTAIINNNMSCIFTFTCSYWLDASGTQNTYIALAVMSFGISCLAIPMYFYGKRIRLWTRKWYNESIDIREGL
ncbi:Protein hol1 [Kluyveromyces marxianus]|nr:Protein hol1 [Kluyveromyces marxianus]KAG0676087.1 Protein hol1 [Kluyveromyces marxianus]